MLPIVIIGTVLIGIILLLLLGVSHLLPALYHAKALLRIEEERRRRIERKLKADKE